jgi:hypothetical protein
MTLMRFDGPQGRARLRRAGLRGARDPAQGTPAPRALRRAGAALQRGGRAGDRGGADALTGARRGGEANGLADGAAAGPFMARPIIRRHHFAGNRWPIAIIDVPVAGSGWRAAREEPERTWRHSQFPVVLG